MGGDLQMCRISFYKLQKNFVMLFVVNINIMCTRN